MISEQPGDAFGASYGRADQVQISREEVGAAQFSGVFLPRLMSLLFTCSSKLKILDVGCGIGRSVEQLRQLGHDAYGIEPGDRLAHSPWSGEFVFGCYAHELKALHGFDAFDLIYSNGVVEHVGTIDGDAALAPDFKRYRQIFIADQLALLRAGGILLVAGPNRLFPFDLQHGPHSYGRLAEIKARFPKIGRLTIPWHRDNFLLSYSDLRAITSGLGQIIPVSIDDYYGFSALGGRPMLASLIRRYLRFTGRLPLCVRQYVEPSLVFVLRKH